MSSETKSAPVSVKLTLLVVIVLNGLLWGITRNLQPKWPGVPPAPTYNGALMMSLGDAQFSYRTSALTIQNLGDTGGRVTPLTNYNYETLDKWFWLLDRLDEKSSYMPLMAAYYFGAIRNSPKSIRIVIDYLAHVGNTSRGENWRWLAQAVFLAKHRLEDLDLSMQLAYKLSKIEPEYDELPMWARNMPAFIHTSKGDRVEAIAFIEAILSTTENLHPNEINFLLSYLKDRLGVDVDKKYGLDQIK